VTHAANKGGDQVFSIFEVIHPGLTLPKSATDPEITDKAFTPEKLAQYRAESSNMQFIKNQMTILGAELAARFDKFFGVLDSSNVVFKTLPIKENQQALKSHLKGLGGVWDDMKGIDTSKVTDNEALPPFKRVRNDWRIKFQDWKDLKEANPKKYNSRFLPDHYAQTDPALYQTLVKRQELTVESYEGRMSKFDRLFSRFFRQKVKTTNIVTAQELQVIKTSSSNRFITVALGDQKKSLYEPKGLAWSESAFLFSARSSCPNMQSDSNFMTNLPNFKTSIIAAGMYFSASDRLGLQLSPSYNYSQHLFLANTCLFDYTMNKDQFSSPEKYDLVSKCGTKLTQLSQYLLKYHAYGKREKEDHTMESQFLLNSIKDNSLGLRKVINDIDILDQSIGQASGLAAANKLLKMNGFNSVPFFWAYMGSETFLPSLLQTLKYAEESHLYETMAMKGSGITHLDY
jgi:hypothetical protein